MAQVNVPDDPNWQRIFKALARFAGKRGRISRECQIEIHAGKNGVKTAAREEDYSPDE